jgi:putative spermidine/putrescine transport system substrate-binding protein
MKYRVGADVEATVLAYREDTLDTPPSGLVDFFDPQKVPGKRAAWKYAGGGILEAALIADGVAPEQLYPLDVDRALKKLDAIRGDLVWWTEGAQSQQLLASGETPMALVWTGRAVDAAEGGAPVKVQWAQWLSQNGWWVIPKGARNKDFAMQVLEYQTSPEAQARLTKLLPYGPTNKGALDKVDPKYKDQLPTSHLDSKITLDPAWWGPNYDAVDKKFQAWLLG